VTDEAAAQAPQERMGCAGALWLFIKLPFMFLKAIPWFGAILRQEAATTTGVRAQASYEELTPPADQAVITTVLDRVQSHDADFDLAATLRGVVRTREVVDQARRNSDASAARPVLRRGGGPPPLTRVLVTSERAAGSARSRGPCSGRRARPCRRSGHAGTCGRAS